MKVETRFISKVGGRTNNEDYGSYIKVGNYYCWIVCDGLGGHDSGEVASKFITEYLIKKISEEPTTDESKIEAYISEANEKLIDLQTKKDSAKTTLTMAVYDGNELLIAHVGDSRIYLLNKNEILYQSRDHSVPQMLFQMGEITEKEIRGHEDGNRVLRVMGTEWEKSKSYIYKTFIPDKEKVGLLLCSDGFWEYILENDMIKSFSKANNAIKWIRNMEKVVLKNSDHATMDNYTAIGVLFK